MITKMETAHTKMEGESLPWGQVQLDVERRGRSEDMTHYIEPKQLIYAF